MCGSFEKSADQHQIYAQKYRHCSYVYRNTDTHISSDCLKKQMAGSMEATTDCSKEQTAPTATDSTLTTRKMADTNGGSTCVVSTGKMKRKSSYECGEKCHICSDCPKKQMGSSMDATTDCPEDQTDPKTTETAPTTTKTADTNSGSTSVVSSGKMKRRTCYEFGRRGHISSGCPKKQTANGYLNKCYSRLTLRAIFSKFFH